MWLTIKSGSDLIIELRTLLSEFVDIYFPIALGRKQSFVDQAWSVLPYRIEWELSPATTAAA
jgi:hypothetical protein